MDDFPPNLTEFRDRFSTEQACFNYLVNLRRPQGFECPACGNQKMWQATRGLFEYKKCLGQTSVTAGTLFHGTRKPLRLCFEAMWHITNQKSGANALGLQRVLGLESYHTAWRWLNIAHLAYFLKQFGILHLSVYTYSFSITSVM